MIDFLLIVAWVLFGCLCVAWCIDDAPRPQPQSPIRQQLDQMLIFHQRAIQLERLGETGLANHARAEARRIEWQLKDLNAHAALGVELVNGRFELIIL